ncbi:MAG: hypothetical protein AAB489_00040 [Patescibacteria group bacterium]
MNTFVPVPASRIPAKTLLLLLGGAFLLSASAFPLLKHTTAFRSMEEVLPLAARIPSLQARLAILEEQVEVAEVHAALRTGSTEERIRQLVLPRAVDLDRAIGALEAVRDVARKKGILRSMSGIDVGRSQSTLAGSLIVTAQPIAFRATLNEEGLATFLQAVDLAGALTIDDLLEPSVREALFLQTETENPVAILSLEQFLSTDLLSFAKDPKPHEERLKKAFSSDGLSQYEHLLHATRLRSSLPLLRGDLGATLEARGLWPLPFLSAAQVEVREAGDGWMEIQFSLLAYAR